MSFFSAFEVKMVNVMIGIGEMAKRGRHCGMQGCIAYSLSALHSIITRTSGHSDHNGGLRFVPLSSLIYLPYHGHS